MGTLTEVILGLGSIVFILAVCYWWAGGMCNTIASLNESLLIARGKFPDGYYYTLKGEKLFSELIETKHLDEDVITCLRNKYPILYPRAEHWLKSSYFTNERFRYQFGLDPDPKIIEHINKAALFEGRDPEQEIEQYLGYVNQKRIDSLNIKNVNCDKVV